MKTLSDLHPHLVGNSLWGEDGRLSGMGEQALSVKAEQLRRLHELPEDVDILGILPALPNQPKLRAFHDFPDMVEVYNYQDHLPREWVPYPQRVLAKERLLYLHIAHRYCFRGVHNGVPLCIEGFEEFLERYSKLAEDEQKFICEIKEANQAACNHP